MGEPSSSWQNFNFRDDEGSAQGMQALRLLLAKLQEAQANPRLKPSVNNLLMTEDLMLTSTQRLPSSVAPMHLEGGEGVPVMHGPMQTNVVPHPLQGPLQTDGAKKKQYHGQERPVGKIREEGDFHDDDDEPLSRSHHKKRTNERRTKRSRRNSSGGSSSSSQSGRSSHGRALRRHCSVSDYTFTVGLTHVEMKAKGQEAVDDLLKNTSKSDLFSSLKAETNTIQWLHWLDILDQQTNSQGFGGLNLDADLDLKGNKQQESLKLESKTGKSSATKDSLDSSVKSGNMFGRGLQTSGDKYPTLKFPEAMVAIAQAAKDLPGWPLMSNKMQMHKCEKCSQEFCSPLNQRRHMRATHRRPLNGDKEDLKKKREQIAGFWDKLSPEDASEVLSAKSLSLLDLSATAVVRALTTQLQQPSLLLLPQTYLKVATALLDLVQNKSTKAPLKSGELFAILEDASEKNMLCGVTSSTMHRCIFDNNPGRVGLETKNLAASLGFLIEYKLVRAWMDDKDAEALRCQKALVEEEEAAQKRRAKLLERKKQRKMRQKEFKDKERRSIESSTCLQELKFDGFPREGEDSLTATQSSPSSSASGLDSHSMETPPMDNGDKFSTDCLEVGQISEGLDEAEESCSGYSNHVNSQKLEMPNGFVEGRDGGPSTGFSSNGLGWKERRQVDAPYFQNNGRQLYGKDRKHYDHQYGGQRLARTPYGVTAFEYFTPRYSHYREKVPVVKRQSTVGGTGHAVWARKTPQTPLTASQLSQNGEVSVNEGRDGYTGALLVGQSERSEIDDQSCSAKSEKGLSRVSSLSSDSANSQSSVSISAKVGAEEQSTPENKTVFVSLPPQIASIERDVGGSAALVIGSVSIPLERPLPGSRRDGQLNESYFPFAFKAEGQSTLPDGSCSPSSAHGGIEGPQLSCILSLDESVIPRGGGSHQSGVREDCTVLSRSVIPGVQNKSVVKVWRPVTPGGERSGPHFAGQPLGEVERLDTAEAQRQETDINSSSPSPIQQQSLSASGGDAEDLNKGQRKPACLGTAIGVLEDRHRPPDPSLTAYYSELANFLAQRWSKAMSSPDIVCHSEMDDFDSGETV
ncbi:hypothetical protein L7F22_004039 [Adiantum nelumboides]|nr:hypothetical protein [Adiantum nelumboides]